MLPPRKECKVFPDPSHLPKQERPLVLCLLPGITARASLIFNRTALFVWLQRSPCPCGDKVRHRRNFSPRFRFYWLTVDRIEKAPNRLSGAFFFILYFITLGHSNSINLCLFSLRIKNFLQIFHGPFAVVGKGLLGATNVFSNFPPCVIP